MNTIMILLETSLLVAHILVIAPLQYVFVHMVGATHGPLHTSQGLHVSVDARNSNLHSEDAPQVPEGASVIQVPHIIPP